MPKPNTSKAFVGITYVEKEKCKKLLFKVGKSVILCQFI